MSPRGVMAILAGMTLLGAAAHGQTCFAPGGCPSGTTPTPIPSWDNVTPGRAIAIYSPRLMMQGTEKDTIVLACNQAAPGWTGVTVFVVSKDKAPDAALVKTICGGE